MYPASPEQFQSVGIEFMTDAPSVTFQLLTSATLFTGVIIVDGVRYNLAPLDAPVTASNANYYTLTFPSGRKVRRWRIEAHQGTSFYIPAISVDSNSTVWAPTDDAIKAVFIGDSLTAGATPGPYVPGNCVPFGVGHELGWGDCWDYSRGSTGYVHTNSGGDAFPYRVAQAAALKPDVFVFMGSWNDIGVAAGSISAAVQSCITTIRASGSTAPIIFFGIWSANNSTLGTIEGAVQAGIIDPLNRSFWIPIYGDPVAPWVLGTWNNNPTPTGFNMSTATNANLYIDSANSPHPSDAGTVFEWQRMADAIRKKVIPALTM
jgi:lysophospholipase L1-like esterase